MVDVKQVADAADMIVNGYAFTRCAEGFRVLNLNRPDRAVVFSNDGKVLETSMDDIEVRIAGDYLEVHGGLRCRSIMNTKSQGITFTLHLTVSSSVCMCTPATVN